MVDVFPDANSSLLQWHINQRDLPAASAGGRE